MSGRTYRLAGWWFLATLLIVAAVFGSDDPEPMPPSAELVRHTPRADNKLRIVSIEPVEAYAGSAVIVRHSPLDPSVFDEVVVEIAKQPTEVLVRGTEHLVVRVPADAPPERLKVRIFHGDRRSKPKDIRIKPRRLRRLLRNLVGGLALFIFGLRTLSSGLRSNAGTALRASIGGWTHGAARGLGFGALAGAIGQSVVSAVALMLGLLQSRLLAFKTALVALLGAHLGAGIAIVVLPLGISRESLWLVALGTLFITFTHRGRGGESVGKVVLGVGLLLHGLSILREGFEPFVGDPDLLAHLQLLRSDGVLGVAVRMLGGTVLGALLQAPGAVFGVVLGLGQSTALLSPWQGLELLGAANIGISLGTVVLALPFGRVARRLAVAHVSLCLASTVVFLIVIPVVLGVSGFMLPTDPSEVVYGKKVLVPHLAEHLALSYIIAQTLSALFVLPLVGPLAGLLLRLMPERRPLGLDRERHDTATGSDPQQLVTNTLRHTLESTRTTMEVALAALHTGQRPPLHTAEESIAIARGQLKDAVAELATRKTESEQLTLSACVTVLRIQQSLEQLLRLAKRGLEKDYDLDSTAQAAFSTLHELTMEGLSEIIHHIEGHASIVIEDARAREIETNNREAKLRERLLERLSDHPGHERDILWWTEVIGAYEGLGNHVYRLAEVFGDPSDEF